MSFDTLAGRRGATRSVEADLEGLAKLAFQLALIDHQTIFPPWLVDSAIPILREDLAAMRDRDPSSRFRPIAVHLSPHATFFAVVSYRLAHALLEARPGADEAVVAAMRLCFSARAHTGVEIHPEAEIGRRLVVDHGFGTVIGQTAEIGDDAYILNGVTLGGRLIGDGPDGKRHPTLGHRVQVGGNARVFGPVRIGDDCLIGPDVTITRDLPAGSTVLARRESVVGAASASALARSFAASAQMAGAAS